MAAGSVEFQERACLACLRSHFGTGQVGSSATLRRTGRGFRLIHASASRILASRHAAGAVLRARRLLHRPAPAGGPRRHHPWPCRPRPARPCRGAGDARDAGHHAGPDGGGGRRHGAAADPPGRGAACRTASPSAWCRRACARLGPGGAGLAGAAAPWSPATTSGSATRPARPSSRCTATSSSPRRPSPCRSSAIRRRSTRSAKLLKSLALFPERTHVVGCYALGKCQRLIRLLREAGWERADPSAWGAGDALRAVRVARRAARPAGAGDGRQQGGAEGRDRAGAALRRAGPLGAAAGGAGGRRWPAAGCGCGSGRRRAASNCRW